MVLAPRFKRKSDDHPGVFLVCEPWMAALFIFISGFEDMVV
jgi:hypothetical protein